MNASIKLLSVFCPFCWAPHEHEAEHGGHRVAHCSNRFSPFRRGGYVLIHELSPDEPASLLDHVQMDRLWVRLDNAGVGDATQPNLLQRGPAIGHGVSWIIEGASAGRVGTVAYNLCPADRRLTEDGLALLNSFVDQPFPPAIRRIPGSDLVVRSTGLYPQSGTLVCHRENALEVLHRLQAFLSDPTSTEMAGTEGPFDMASPEYWRDFRTEILWERPDLECNPLSWRPDVRWHVVNFSEAR